MVRWLIAIPLVALIVVLGRGCAGRRLGNEVRAVSDRLMLRFLQLTSEFERQG